MKKTVQEELRVSDDFKNQPKKPREEAMSEYKLVPVVLTPEMIKADPYGLGYGRLQAIWASMLAVAPEQQVEQWSSVEDRLPAEKEAILMVAVNQGPRGDYTTDQYAGWRSVGVWCRWPHDFHPTHWMPLPAAPSASPDLPEPR